MSKIKQIVKEFMPPVLYRGLLSISEPLRAQKYQPSWARIASGPAKGRDIFVSEKRPIFRDMIVGDHDQFFWDYLDQAEVDLRGNTIIDIGGHIGYHSMCFSELVGEGGFVHVFEPNRSNIDRMKKIFRKNAIDRSTIDIHQYALGDRLGSIEFNCSNNVDGGGSFGGYIEGSDIPLSASVYKNAKFETVSVDVETLDHFFEADSLSNVGLIKIDVEGAEHLVLDGGRRLITMHQPILFIEIHSVSAMMHVCNILTSLKYEAEIIDGEEVTPSRCFIVGYPSGINAEIST